MHGALFLNIESRGRVCEMLSRAPLCGFEPFMVEGFLPEETGAVAQ